MLPAKKQATEKTKETTQLQVTNTTTQRTWIGENTCETGESKIRH